jgi:chromosome segregation ATPase
MPDPDWKQQAEQFRAELDRVNPQLDAANSRVRELEARLALAEKERSEAVATVERQMETVSKLDKSNTQASQAAADHAGRAKEFAAEVSRLRGVLSMKSAALSECLRGVSDQLKRIQAAIDAG